MADVVPRRYRLAGLELVSDFVLLEAGEAGTQGTEPPLVIEDGTRRGMPPPHGGNARSADAMRVRVVQPDVGRFVVEDGRRVVAWPEPDASAGGLSQLLTGTILAVALMQRGTLVLHGCVVAIGGRAIAVLGHCGDGKSTTAAACAARGYQVLSDDLVVLDLAEEAVRARAVAPLVRMRDAATLTLSGARRWHATDKTVVGLHDAGTQAAVPLAAIIRLEWGDTVSLRPEQGVGAVLNLLEHAFCRPIFQPRQVSATMSQCTALVDRCPVAVLTRPRRLDVLDTVVAHLEGISSVSA